jgi:hypothetical protein
MIAKKDKTAEFEYIRLGRIEGLRGALKEIKPQGYEDFVRVMSDDHPGAFVTLRRDLVNDENLILAHGILKDRFDDEVKEAQGGNKPKASKSV